MNREDQPRFLADAMLGRLARRLRALGYDTFYDSGLEDGALAELARREGRILVTRDVELTRRRGLSALLIRDDQVTAQLRQVVGELGLNDEAAFTRCIECNTVLRELANGEAKTRVPPYVFETQTRFSECPQCARVYWRGTHWTHMQDLFRSMERDLRE
jgi:uncharacterized protein